MKELVRCRPCGFVMDADKLGDVCPACGLPRKVFEPYRERVSLNRLFLSLFIFHRHWLSQFQCLQLLSIFLAIFILRY
jgi:rubredoxin